MKVEILRANIVGDKKDLKKVFDVLKSTGGFQVTEYQKSGRYDYGNDRYENLQATKKRIETALEIANMKPTPRIEIAYNELDEFMGYEHDAMRVVESLEELHSNINHTTNTITHNTEVIRGLLEYTSLPVPFSALENTASVKILCGIMPSKKFAIFQKDFANTKMNIVSYPSGKYNKCVVITVHRDDEPITDAIHHYDFMPTRFAFDKTASEQIEILKAENIELHEKHDMLLKDTALLPEEAKALKCWYDYVCNEIDTIDLIVSTIQTDRYYVLNGWIVASAIDTVKAELQGISPDVVCTFDKPSVTDNPPVLVKSPKIISPFQNITEMYGSPGRRDVDPNPFVAFFYFLFFGFMIGDIGYALILAVGVAAFIYFKKPSYGTKQFMLLFGICSASALAWGLVFGSIFGFKIGTQLIDPLEGAIYVMLLSLGLGLLQLSVGVIINTWNLFKNGNYVRATVRGIPRVVLFVGLLLWLPKMAFQLFDLSSVAFFNAISPVGMWITISGAVGTACTNPYNLISYFNDTVSYIRLFALALVGTVIASVGNIIGGMMPLAIGIPVAVLFHIFNLGLGLLSAYIHGARLQFIEFFSKFYNGDGQKFSPVGGNLRYNVIKGGNL